MTNINGVLKEKMYNVEQYRNRDHCWSWDFPDRKITIDLDAEVNKEEKL